MKTNRHLYKAIEALIKEKENTPIILLEKYLISLLGRGLEKRYNKVPDKKYSNIPVSYKNCIFILRGVAISSVI
jgi:hypothetical protein